MQERLKPDVQSNIQFTGKLKNEVVELTNNVPYSEAVAFSALELLENARIHGTLSADGFTGLSLVGDDKSITIEVKSHLPEDSDENLDKLDDLIQFIRGFQSPREAFKDSLRQVWRNRGGIARMGLARIAYVHHAALDFFVLEDNSLVMSAVIHADRV